MASTVQDLKLVLETFFPVSMPFRDVFLALALMVSILPLLRLHNNQRNQPRQPRNTAWMKAIGRIYDNEFGPGDPGPYFLGNRYVDRSTVADNIIHDLEGLFDLLGIDIADSETPLFPAPPRILVTSRVNCVRCHDRGLPNQALRKHTHPRTVRILNENFTWETAYLFAAHCVQCNSDYYPDRITFPNPDDDQMRMQRPEFDAQFLRVSLRNVWMHRKVALAQERAVARFSSGWAAFAEWLNETFPNKPAVTMRQSKRLFIEHFGRRLLEAHGKSDVFVCPANLPTDDLAAAIRSAIGENGGTIPSALDHSCMDCTHKKRYQVDLVEEGMEISADDDAQGVAGLEPEMQDTIHVVGGEEEIVPQTLQERPVQQAPPAEGEPRGYVRLAVMDGKAVGHRICSITTCRKPLQNFKNGRFCQEHVATFGSVCGIIPCGRPLCGTAGAMTCDNEEHKSWYSSYQSRFKRLTFPGVQRVLRRQQARQTQPNPAPDHLPQLHIESTLPNLGAVSGSDVVHTFRAGSVYCIQTVQWACGTPIGWGKCYRSESSPQVLAILDNIWAGNEHRKPNYIAYDDACDLLRHIATQNINSPWLNSTRFIVDAWHYIGHKATDALCRLWCNPAPTNGSQPDLIIAQKDDDGQLHITRAFNTETAEQLNAWIDRYDAQLRQMTDITFDFFVHSLLMLYGETVSKRIDKEDRYLTEEFWDDVLG